MPDPDVLVVEDEMDVQALLVEVFERAAIEIRVAEDGTTALERVGERWAPVVVLDLTLPGALDGWQVWERLRDVAAGRPLRVLLFTATLDSSGQAKAAEWGAFAVVKKPATSRQLIAAVKRALETGGG